LLLPTHYVGDQQWQIPEPIFDEIDGEALDDTRRMAFKDWEI
jgi:hypothetical protein